MAGTWTTCRCWTARCWLTLQPTSAEWSYLGSTWACVSLPSAGILKTTGVTLLTIFTGRVQSLHPFCISLSACFCLISAVLTRRQLFATNNVSFMQGGAKDVVRGPCLCCRAAWVSDEESRPWAVWIPTRPSSPASYHHESQHPDEQRCSGKPFHNRHIDCDISYPPSLRTELLDCQTYILLLQRKYIDK